VVIVTSEEIKRRREYYAKMSDVEQKEVMGATAQIAFADIADSLDIHGNLDFKKAKKSGTTALIKKISRTQTKYGENTAIEFYSKQDALKTLGDYLGMKIEAKDNPANASPEQKAQLYYDTLVKNKMAEDKALKITRDTWKMPTFDPKKEYVN